MDALIWKTASIKTQWLNHPQGCLGFRIETKEGVLVYATDNEPGDAEFDKGVRKLAEGADILIYDAQYLPEDYAARRRGWGHSHWREAVNVAMESGAKELILYHHDPDHTDAIVDKVVADARSYYPTGPRRRRRHGNPPLARPFPAATELQTKFSSAVSA